MPHTPYPPLAELWDEVHAAFDRVFTRHPAALACRAGCADCCVAGLSINQVEADAILGWLDTISAEERAHIAELVARPQESSCVLLNADMGCSIYPARPVICRVFGIPMRQSYPPGTKVSRKHLPLYNVFADTAKVVNTCNKNFIEVSVDAVKNDCIVDDQSIRLRRKAASAGFVPRDGSPVEPPAVRHSLANIIRKKLGVPEPVESI